MAGLPLLLSYRFVRSKVCSSRTREGKKCLFLQTGARMSYHQIKINDKIYRQAKATQRAQYNFGPYLEFGAIWPSGPDPGVIFDPEVGTMFSLSLSFFPPEVI